VAVTGYLLTETSTAPAPFSLGLERYRSDDLHLFELSGTKTLYAWAKDASGNVSTSLNDSVTITLDITLPTVTGFVIPSTATSLTVNITTFTASDNVGVTGYMLTQSATSPAPSASGWERYRSDDLQPFRVQAQKTLYAWAKDGAGNVSTSVSHTITSRNLPRLTLSNSLEKHGQRPECKTGT